MCASGPQQVGRRGEYMRRFRSGNVKKKDHLQDLVVDGSSAATLKGRYHLQDLGLNRSSGKAEGKTNWKTYE
jgi:hypothetical protein